MEESTAVALYDDIERDLRQARLNGDQRALISLGLLKSEIVNASKEPGAKGVDDAAVIRVTRREVKKREEAAELYRSGGRAETADQELAEADILRRYLPAAISEEDLDLELRAVIAEVGASGPQGFGQVMKAATARIGDRAEGGRIATAVRRLLNG